MINQYIKRCIKNKISFFIVIPFLLYGLLLIFVTDFALWTSSTSEEIYEPMKSFYSLYSVFSMTFIFLPVYFIWIYSLKTNRIISIELVRYKSFDKYIGHILMNSFTEALLFNLCVIITIILSSLRYFQYLKWGIIAAEGLNALVGFWVISMLAELFLILYHKRQFFSIIFSFLVLLIDYIFYCKFDLSFIVYPMLIADSAKSLHNYLYYFLYSAMFLLIIYTIISIVFEKKSIYKDGEC